MRIHQNNNIMAELNINGRLLVKNFKKQFKEVFGGSLRVYKGKNFADDNLTLAAIRAEGCKGGELTLRANMLVGNFEDKMQELFGIKVQVADADDKKLVDNGLTLGAVGRGEVKKKAIEKEASSSQEQVQKAPASNEPVAMKEVEFDVTLYSDKAYLAREVFDSDVNLGSMSEEEARQYVESHHDEILNGWDTDTNIRFAAIGAGADEESLKATDANGEESDYYDWFDSCFLYHRPGKYYKNEEGRICKAVAVDADDPRVKGGMWPEGFVTLQEADDYRTKPEVKVYCVDKIESDLVFHCTVEIPENEDLDLEELQFESHLLPCLLGNNARNLQSIKDIWYGDIRCDLCTDGPALRELGIVVVSIAEDGTERILYSDVDKGSVSAPQKTVVADKGKGNGPFYIDNLMDWLKKECVVESDDDTYYDASSAKEADIALFIKNLKAQNNEEENNKLEQLSFKTDGDFDKYLAKDQDGMGLVSKLIIAAYCTMKGIVIDNTTELHEEERQYFIHDNRAFYYGDFIEINLG